MELPSCHLRDEAKIKPSGLEGFINFNTVFYDAIFYRLIYFETVHVCSFIRAD